MKDGEANSRIVVGEAGRTPGKVLAADGSESIWQRRIQDWLRHAKDLQTRTYEGATSRPERERVFRTAFELVTPVALRVLEDINTFYLENTGELTVRPLANDGQGGLIGGWSLDWPLLKAATSRFTGEPLEPLTLFAIFPLIPTGAMQWTHPHIAMLRSGRPDGIAAAWPLQVTSPEDAERQEPILRVLAEAEFHERTYLADVNCRILPLVTK
jgi:hypothetical protein